MRISVDYHDDDKVKLELLDKITFKDEERSNIKGIVEARKFEKIQAKKLVILVK